MPEGYVLCQGNSSVSWQDYAKKKKCFNKTWWEDEEQEEAF